VQARKGGRISSKSPRKKTSSNPVVKSHERGQNKREEEVFRGNEKPEAWTLFVICVTGKFTRTSEGRWGGDKREGGGKKK